MNPATAKKTEIPIRTDSESRRISAVFLTEGEEMNEYFREIAHTMKYGNAVKAAEILEELKKPVPSCSERNAVLNQAVSEHWSAVRTD